MRERAIRLTAVTEPAAKELNDRVLAQKFLGDVTRLDVAVEGFERPLKVRAESTEGLKKGADVRVTIDPAGVLVFPADGANVS